MNGRGRFTACFTIVSTTKAKRDALIIKTDFVLRATSFKINYNPNKKKGIV